MWGSPSELLIQPGTWKRNWLRAKNIIDERIDYCVPLIYAKGPDFSFASVITVVIYFVCLVLLLNINS